MTAPTRADRVAELGNQLGRRPSSNEVRRALGCGREVANRLLAALDKPDGPAAPDGPATPAEDTTPPIVVPEDTGGEQPSASGPDTEPTPATGRATREPRHGPWLVLLAAPAFVAIWSGWVGLGGLTGFGLVHPLPGIADQFTLNTAITLPIGVETYAAYALRVWLTGTGSATARRFAKWSAIGSLVLGAAGQVAYHLMTAAHVTAAPWEITTVVACLPVVVLGCGAGLLHLTSHPQHTSE